MYICRDQHSSELWFLRENILSLLSDHLRQDFDDFYWDYILGRDKLSAYNVEDTAVIILSTLHSHEVMVELYKNEINSHPSITSIFVCLLITANIYEPLQDIYQMK